MRCSLMGSVTEHIVRFPGTARVHAMLHIIRSKATTVNRSDRLGKVKARVARPQQTQRLGKEVLGRLAH